MIKYKNQPILGLMGPHFLGYSLTGINPEPMGNESTFTVPRNSFQTKEGKWVALSASAQVPFERMMDLVGRIQGAQKEVIWKPVPAGGDPFTALVFR
jgi:crotonobetainyl-CoA:carnitine CoA-transferase CaiB-like acyl-CoA transferase